MKTIVCYGDSNTWGSDPVTHGRFAPDVRWTGVLQTALGAGYKVIEEGLGGRTTIVDDPISPWRNGRAYLIPCLESHNPFDLVTIMLGTNDLKQRLNRSASDIAESAALLAAMARRLPVAPGGVAPLVLLMAPPVVTKLTTYEEMFTGAVEKSRRFAGLYRAFGERHPGVTFFDAGAVVTSSDLDGIHFEAAEHAKLGRAVAVVVRDLLGGTTP